eukprot:gene16363-25084_t
MAERIDASMAEDDREMKLLPQKEVAPAPEITTQELWDTQVMDPAAGLVAVAFLDPSFSSLKQVLRDLTRARTAVKAACEPESVLFISAKHGTMTLKGMKTFIKGTLAKSPGRELGD